MKYIEARDFIIEEVKKEVFGPEPIGAELDTKQELRFSSDDLNSLYGPYFELGTGQEILTRETPTGKYGAGVLYPINFDDYTRNEEDIAGVTSEDTADLTGDNSDEAKEAKQYDESPETVSYSGSEEEEFEIAGANLTKFQSSMGVSFHCELNQDDRITIENPSHGCGAYSLLETFVDDKQTRNGFYVRRDVKFKASFIVDEKYNSYERFIDNPTTELRENSDKVINLDFTLFVRPHENNKSKIITATLTNRTDKNLLERNQICLFQTGFEIRIYDNKDNLKNSFLPYPIGELTEKVNSDNEEEKILDLLYKNKLNFAIGHGCTAKWQNKNQKSNLIEATCFPVSKIPNVTAEVEGENIKIPMNTLAGIIDGDKFQLLNVILKEYQLWINKEKSKINNLDERFKSAANKNIQKCEVCLERMEDGIKFLKEDQLALKAFELSNEAILTQQYRLSGPKREISVDKKSGDFFYEQTIADHKLEIEHDFLGKWRPFQLAFILSSIKSAALGKDSRRQDVELIFFPTGGGKTEAYLGLASFISFYRRLKNIEDDGVHVIMRYTLRLLTAQQFTRASGVICAMEFIRRREEKILGSKKFSIGLWVGGSNTPNRNNGTNGAVSIYNELLRKKEAKYPFVISRCPWCAAQIGKVEGQRRAKLVGLDNEDGKIIFAKHDPKCEFNDGLPIYVVDEDIYEEKPTIIIATVDKFAQLAWSPTKIRELFGITDDGHREKPPPSLILQDELHLITGPLGSMVGLYEGLIEELCSINDGELKIKPKIVCSTATIRSYQRQIKDLYNRDNINLFPPHGLDESDSFFSKHALKDEILHNPKKYIGLMTPNYPSPQTTQVRIYSRLLFSAHKLPDESKDPFYTLMNFFGSIREIQTTHSLIQVDIKSRLMFLKNRYGNSFNEIRKIPHFIELTSRIASEEVPATIDKLSKVFNSNNKGSSSVVDICNASNIIEVGIDIDRLSLLTVLGQPKTTSSYIQVTGRIGRKWEERPGCVFTIYNSRRPRDKSHFEQFFNYHNKLYAQVEPMSVTPFANPVIKRALHAIAISFVRIFGSNETGMSPDPFPERVFKQFEDMILSRVKNIDPKEVSSVEDKLSEIRENWKLWGHQRYDLDQQESDGLMYRSGTYVRDDIKPYSYDTPTSLRNVDAECRGSITHSYRGDENVKESIS